MEKLIDIKTLKKFLYKKNKYFAPNLEYFRKI